MAKPSPLPSIRARHAHDCGISAARCLLEYHLKRPVNVPDLSTEPDGTNPSTLEALIRSRKSERWHVVSGEMAIEDVAHYCGTARPVICLITNAEGAGHYVVAAGVWRGRVWFQDSDFEPGETGWGSAPVTEFESWRADFDRRGQTYHRWGLAAWVG